MLYRSIIMCCLRDFRTITVSVSAVTKTIPHLMKLLMTLKGSHSKFLALFVLIGSLSLVENQLCFAVPLKPSAWVFTAGLYEENSTTTSLASFCRLISSFY